MNEDIRFENVEVARLPHPHAPFRCAHSARFKVIMQSHGLTDRDFSTPEVAREFYESLMADDFSACPYHEADWPQIAAVGCAAVDDFGPEGPDMEQLSEVIERSNLNDSDALWLVCLFGDPIMWRDGAEELLNGQSRTCALRASGVERCPVEMELHRSGT